MCFGWVGSWAPGPPQNIGFWHLKAKKTKKTKQYCENHNKIAMNLAILLGFFGFSCVQKSKKTKQYCLIRCNLRWFSQYCMAFLAFLAFRCKFLVFWVGRMLSPWTTPKHKILTPKSQKRQVILLVCLGFPLSKKTAKKNKQSWLIRSNLQRFSQHWFFIVYLFYFLSFAF